MNKLCVHLFTIIFMLYTRNIPTVTNFASILANCFHFLWKITILQPSVLNFEVDSSSFAKKVLDKLSKNGFVGHGLRRMLLKILCSGPHFERCLKTAINST